MNVKDQLIEWAEKYNNPKYFEEDPIAFPKLFMQKLSCGKGTKQDVEIAALFAAHFAWGKRAMIVRDCNRLFDFMEWEPYKYVMQAEYRNDNTSIHRTIKWTDIANICQNLKTLYSKIDSIEHLTQDQIRTNIFSQKTDLKAANKKINMLRRWLVRDDGKVDLGLWKDISKTVLLIPLDVHVHRVATTLGLTNRKQKDIITVQQITNSFKTIFPTDPCLGDFALFGYGVTNNWGNTEQE